jgi:hypothetical protein
MKKSLLLNLLLVLSLGCVQATGEESSDDASTEASATEFTEPTSLEAEENGGYETEDEEPMFGLESMEQYEADAEEEDPTVSEEEETAAEADPEAQVYLIRIVWGNLALNGRDDRDLGRTEADWIDWSGSLSFNGDGELLLKRTILFDRHDSIVREDDPLAIEWQSYTGPHIDGILAKLIYHPSEEGEAPVVSFVTDPVTQEIAVLELDHYNEIVTIDEEGHGAAFTALRVDDDDCEEGFLHGKFHDRPEGEGGIFRGAVLSETGALNGHVRGHYGVNDEEEQVFFGKYINTTGHYRGILHGSYGDGAFEGTWFEVFGLDEGVLNGKYVTGAEVDSGFFQGFWEASCVVLEE